MLKSLCLAAVCLLSHVNALGGINSGNVNCNDSDNNNISRVNEIERTNDDTLTIIGTYNFVDEFEVDTFEGDSDTYIYYFENISVVAGSPIRPASYTRACPIYYNGGYFYLWEINIYVYPLNDDDDRNDCLITFSYYDENEALSSFQFAFYSDLPDLSDYDDTLAYNIFFNVISPIYAHGDDAELWKHIFTSDSNNYVLNYTGYFTFTNGYLLGNNYYAILGTISNSTRVSFMYNFYSVGGSSINSVTWLVYDVMNNKYSSSSFYISDRTSNYLYLSNVKMLRSTYNSLNGSIGVFSYVDSSSPSDFEDLLFSIADTPLYFIVSLFNFEMLGINLYIALAGLLTLVIVIVIIRKIW